MSHASPAPPRSALLGCWASAWLAGDAALAELVTRVTAEDDRHEVSGLTRDDLPLGPALGQLRAAGVTTLRVVLPVPGDVLGLPGPGPFGAAALNASEGLLALRADLTGYGLVPTLTVHGSPFDGTVTTVAWTVHAVDAPVVDVGPWLAEAEHDLRRGLVEATGVLQALDTARWRADLAGALAQLRAQTRAGIDNDELPHGFSVRARDVLVQARTLAAVLRLATADVGGALDTRAAVAREQALRDLERLVRRARVAAYNSYGYGRPS